MPFLDNPQLMRQIIMDHYENPHNKYTPEHLENYQQVHMKPSSCADDFIYYLQVDENGTIVDLSFDGVGCTIATSSSSIMTELIKGGSIKNARQTIAEFRQMIDGKAYDEDLLDEAIVFKNTARQPARIKCATLGYDALEMMLDEIEGKHSHG